MLLIVSGASGAGKSTLCKTLLERRPELSLSVSVTTRKPRGEERDGREYHFVSEERFGAMVDEGDFAEHAVVHGFRYGTSRTVTDSAVAEGRSVIFDVDWQGAEALAKAYPEAVTVMILPPTFEVLATRLRGRGTDEPAVIERRLQAARLEISKYASFDYLILNDNAERASRVLESIYEACLHAQDRMKPTVEALLIEGEQDRD